MTALAVAVYLLFVPLVVSILMPSFAAYDAARLSQLAYLPMVAALGWRAKHGRVPDRVVALSLTLAALGLLSSSMAANSQMALREWLNVAALVGFAAVVAAQPESSQKFLAYMVALAVLVYAVPVLTMATVGAFQGLPMDAALPLPGYANRRFLNHVQTVALPLAVWGLVGFQSRALRALSGIGLLASGSLLWITFGRGTLLGFGVAIAVLALYGVRGRREALGLAVGFASALLLAGLIAIALQMLTAPIVQAKGFSRDAAPLGLTADNSRFGLWQRAWEMALQSPLLGAGPMHYAYGNHEKAAHPHSMPLQLFSEWGLLATVLWFVLLAWLLVALVRKLHTTRGTEFQFGACLLAAWIAVVVDSFFSGIWVMPVSQVWLATLLGLSGAWIRPVIYSTPTVSRLWNLLPLALSIALTTHCFPELRDLREHLETVKKRFPGEGARPRFWSHGHFD